MTPKDQPQSDLPKVGAPAQRALAGAGLQRLEQIAAVSEADLMKLHGIGKNALEQLRLALHAKWLSFKNERQQGE
jgi:predicted flap endonuclease-1-like 5' DNA nuclease